MSFHGPHTEEAKRLIGAANSLRVFSEATREKKRQARLGKRDSEETRAKKRANLERARQKRMEKLKPTCTYTECDFCGKLGPEEEKTSIRYEEEEIVFGLCKDCFAQWQQKPDEAVVISGRGQEKTA